VSPAKAGDGRERIFVFFGQRIKAFFDDFSAFLGAEKKGRGNSKNHT
jgi:hypothetical protein